MNLRSAADLELTLLMISGDLLAGSLSSLNRCKNYFFQVLNGVRQTSVHTAELEI